MIQYYNGEYIAVAEIFHAAVHQTAACFYSSEQLDAWAPTPIDYEQWRARCELKRPFICLRPGQVVGFIELDTNGHIGCHYVHPDHNRQGYGSALLAHAIKTALDAGLMRLYVEASHVAKGLYLKHGFQVVSSNQVSIGGVHLENWIMEMPMPNKAVQRTPLRSATDL
jgi:putative acetyltransferase